MYILNRYSIVYDQNVCKYQKAVRIFPFNFSGPVLFASSRRTIGVWFTPNTYVPLSPANPSRLYTVTGFLYLYYNIYMYVLGRQVGWYIVYSTVCIIQFDIFRSYAHVYVVNSSVLSIIIIILSTERYDCYMSMTQWCIEKKMKGETQRQEGILRCRSLFLSTVYNIFTIIL